MSGMMLRGCCCGGEPGFGCCPDLTKLWTGGFVTSVGVKYDSSDCTLQFGALSCTQFLPAINTSSSLANMFFGVRNTLNLNTVFLDQTNLTLQRGGPLPDVDPWCYYVANHPSNGVSVCAPTFIAGSPFTSGFAWYEDNITNDRFQFTHFVVQYYATPYFETALATTRWEAGMKITFRHQPEFGSPVFAQMHFGKIANPLTECPDGLLYLPSTAVKNLDNYHGYASNRANSWTCAGNSNISNRSFSFVQYASVEPNLNVAIT